MGSASILKLRRAQLEFHSEGFPHCQVFQQAVVLHNVTALHVEELGVANIAVNVDLTCVAFIAGK